MTTGADKSKRLKVKAQATEVDLFQDTNPFADVNGFVKSPALTSLLERAEMVVQACLQLYTIIKKGMFTYVFFGPQLKDMASVVKAAMAVAPQWTRAQFGQPRTRAEVLRIMSQVPAATHPQQDGQDGQDGQATADDDASSMTSS